MQGEMVSRDDQRGSACFRGGWFAARWLVVPLILLALSLSGVSLAQAHPGASVADAISVGHAAVGADADCCADHSGRHASETCSVLGHCSACAVEEAATEALATMTVARLCLGAVQLPASRGAIPFGPPPKVSHRV